MDGWLEPLCREPTPVEAAVLGETVEHLFASLDEDERPILEMTLQGYTTREISERLGRAERTVRLLREKRRHGNVTMALLAAFVILPWLALAAFGDDFAPFLRVALAPGCLLLGYSQARTLVTRYRLQRRLFRPRDLVTALVPVLVFTLPAALLATRGQALSSTLLTADLLGCWLAGTCMAGLVTAAEAIVSTVQSSRTVATSVAK
jgi:hypothetical protein